jgi:hypothetical protein
MNHYATRQRNRWTAHQLTNCDRAPPPSVSKIDEKHKTAPRTLSVQYCTARGIKVRRRLLVANFVPEPAPSAASNTRSYTIKGCQNTRGGFMANLLGLVSFVSELKTTRTNLVQELRHVDAALAVLGKLNAGNSYTKPRHSISASARKRMSLAQKARWGKAKGEAPKPKRIISAAGRRRIAAAQRARWAKMRAGKK